MDSMCSSLIFVLLFLLFSVCSEWLAVRDLSPGKSECRVVRKLGTLAEYVGIIKE